MTANPATNTNLVGRILRASTRGFDCGTHSRYIGAQHNLGAFVKAPIANDQSIYAIGTIYKIEIKDDQLISELVLGEEMPSNILRDQRENRMIPVEVKCLTVGYLDYNRGDVYHALAPRPPMSLSDVETCTSEEAFAFSARFDYFRIILGASEVPSDDLLVASIRASAWYRGENERYQYLVNAGRELARLLSNDMKRLSHILALIRP
jgi:hypothetical protein